jgi:hypothetical protein
LNRRRSLESRASKKEEGVTVEQGLKCCGFHRD